MVSTWETTGFTIVINVWCCVCVCPFLNSLLYEDIVIKEMIINKSILFILLCLCCPIKCKQTLYFNLPVLYMLDVKEEYFIDLH